MKDVIRKIELYELTTQIMNNQASNDQESLLNYVKTVNDVIFSDGKPKLPAMDYCNEFRKKIEDYVRGLILSYGESIWINQIEPTMDDDFSFFVWIYFSSPKLFNEHEPKLSEFVRTNFNIEALRSLKLYYNIDMIKFV